MLKREEHNIRKIWFKQRQGTLYTLGDLLQRMHVGKQAEFVTQPLRLVDLMCTRVIVCARITRTAAHPQHEGE